MPRTSVPELGLALSSATRVSILAKVSEVPMNVGGLAKALALAQSTVSYHLGILCRAGLVTIEEEGTRHIVDLACTEIRIPIRGCAA